MARRKRKHVAPVIEANGKVPVADERSFLRRMGDGLMKVVGSICGLCIIAGAGFLWHEWHMDGFIAVVMGSAGIGLIYRCVTGHGWGWWG